MLTKYRSYKNIYNVDVKRFSIYNNNNMDRNKVSVGDEIDVLVREIDDNGRGVGFYKGYRVLVPKGFVNEKVRVRIIKIFDEGLQGVIVHRYNSSD